MILITTSMADFPNMTATDPVDFNYTLVLLGSGAAICLCCTTVIAVFIALFIRRKDGQPARKIVRYEQTVSLRMYTCSCMSECGRYLSVTLTQ